MIGRGTIVSPRRAPDSRVCDLIAIFVLLAVAVLAHAGQARAAIQPAITLDGPSEQIAGFGGVAMAEDGSAGVVYLKRAEGVAHVFVARYVEGRWLAPVRVDTQQPFAASSPRIGAASNGQLTVTWATPFATEGGKPVQELLSSTLSPGSEAFGPAIIVDPDVREGVSLSPDLAMSSTGQAYIVYRVIQSLSTVSQLHPGDVAESIRVARFNGERWTRLGNINRDPGLSMRPPTDANAPRVVIGPTGTGVVVWQEPEITGVARIWARRLFSTSVDYVMLASVTTFNGSAIEEDADAPAAAFSPLGQAEVAYRQPAGRNSPLPGPRIFLNTLPDGEAAAGAQFSGAMVADPNVPGGKSASVGRPSIDIEERRNVRLLYDSNGVPRVVQGTGLGLTGVLSLGSPFVGSSLVPASSLPAASAIDGEGGGVAAWPSADAHGAPAVAVRQDYPLGGVQTGLVSGGDGGPIGELAVGRSGLGDGLVAFQQGELGNAAIVVAQASAVPAGFIVEVPKGWIKPSRVRIAWEPAASANGPISYTLVLDGHRLGGGSAARSMVIGPQLLSSGIHTVQVLAVDRYGQATLTTATKLRIDGQAPEAKVRRISAASVEVAVRDPQSGVVGRLISVSFGDGSHTRGRRRARHRYAHAGTYSVLVGVRDAVGNRRTIRLRVSVR